MEARLDEAAAGNPHPGRRTFQRLNRAEYTRSIRELLDLDVDVNAFLPPDTTSRGFDNIADVQGFSATAMQGYLRAASEISRLAMGDPDAVAKETTYKIPRTASQLVHVEGAPFGTRGGTSVIHNFPADGDYVFKIMMHSGPTGFLFGTTVKNEKLEISVDGRRVALLEIDRFMHEQDPTGMNAQTLPITVRSGPHRVSAAFIVKWDGPVEDVIAPIEHTLADTQIGSSFGITTLPHLRDLIVSGPYNPTGISDTPSRRKIFTCRPTSPDDELPCATAIISSLATSAVAGTEKTADQFQCACGPGLELGYELSHLKDHIFQIAIKDFMDAYTFNVKQVMKCCVGILVPDGRIIPFCAYNSVGYRETIREEMVQAQVANKKV